MLKITDIAMLPKSGYLPNRARTFGRGTVRRGTVRRKKNASFG